MLNMSAQGQALEEAFSYSLILQPTQLVCPYHPIRTSTHSFIHSCDASDGMYNLVRARQAIHH